MFGGFWSLGWREEGLLHLDEEAAGSGCAVRPLARVLVVLERSSELVGYNDIALFPALRLAQLGPVPTVLSVYEHRRHATARPRPEAARARTAGPPYLRSRLRRSTVARVSIAPCPGSFISSIVATPPPTVPISSSRWEVDLKCIASGPVRLLVRLREMTSLSLRGDEGIMCRQSTAVGVLL